MSVPVAAQPIPYPAERPYQPHVARWSSGMGTGLLVGGGFEEFTSNGMQNMTGPGGTWNARFVAGTRKYIGVEAAYRAPRTASTRSGCRTPRCCWPTASKAPSA